MAHCKLGRPQLAVGTAQVDDVVRVFWQPRCYDHNCRTPETVLEKTNYCHINPVKRGLVREPGDWRWSSYNWYIGKRDVPIEIDEFDGVLAE